MSWKVVDKSNTLSVAEQMACLLFPPLLFLPDDYRYTLEDENGTRKTVIARDGDDLTKKIEHGDFEDD